MEAQTWTVIGLLAATLIGTLVYLGSRIDGINGRIDSLGTRLDGRMDGLVAEVRAQSARMDGRMDGLVAEVRTQSARMDGFSGRSDELSSGLGDRIFELASKLETHLKRHAS